MKVAAFGPNTGWSGKSITYEGGQFILEGHGSISARDVLDYDARGQLEWAYGGLREWVSELADSPTAPTSEPQAPSISAKTAQPPKRRGRFIIGVAVATVLLLAIIVAGIASSDGGDLNSNPSPPTVAVEDREDHPLVGTWFEMDPETELGFSGTIVTIEPGDDDTFNVVWDNGSLDGDDLGQVEYSVKRDGEGSYVATGGKDDTVFTLTSGDTLSARYTGAGGDVVTAALAREAPGDTSAQQQEAVSAEVTPEPDPEPEPTKPVSYKGSGDRIIKIKKPSGEKDEAVIVTISHNGYANFAVWSLDKKLRQDQLLVNTIGDYKGIVPLDFEGGQQTTRLQVEADGSWKMAIKPITSVRRFSSKIKGKGDDVVYFKGGSKIGNIKHSGSGNFAVWYYGSDYTDLLVNEIGNYKGQSPLPGEAVMVVTADGSWSIVAR